LQVDAELISSHLGTDSGLDPDTTTRRRFSNQVALPESPDMPEASPPATAQSPDSHSGNKDYNKELVTIAAVVQTVYLVHDSHLELSQQPQGAAVTPGGAAAAVVGGGGRGGRGGKQHNKG
jgi:hypothetical protein